MRLKWISLFSLMAVFALLIPATLRADVHDNAQIFSDQAVQDANRDMKQMQHDHGKQLVIETFKAVPDDQKAAEQKDPKTFFKNWMASRAKELKVNGVYVLICMDPKHLEVGAGKETVAHGDFTREDVDALRTQMQAALHEGDYDKALSGAVENVEQAYSENIQPNKSQSNGGAYIPNYQNYGVPYAPSRHSTGVGGTLGSLICLAIGAVIIISIVRTIFRGGSGGGFGGYYPPGNQGYGQGYGGNFGGYGGGGGGGFGRGLLGGLLGGALGSYVENRFDQRNDQGNSGFFGGGAQSGGNFGGGGGGSFDSGPSDAGQGFGDNSSGGDFGSSGGGGDSGGGGGGSSGGDF